MAGPFVLPVEVVVDPATVEGVLAIGLEVDVAAPASLAVPLSVSVYDASRFPGHNGTAAGGTFSLYVEVGGQDLTSRLIGSVEVDGEEGAARVATFTLVLESGSFQPDEWINLPVIIEYFQGPTAFRLFTGIVDLPVLSLEDSSVVFSCTDNLQGRFEGKDRSVIETLFANTGARWSQGVFGDYENSEQFAEDLLSTIAASADLDRNGQLVFGQWYAPGYDFLFSDAEVFPESISVEWGSRRDIITQVNIEAEYTWQNFRERKQRYVWDHPYTFEQYLETNTSLPNTTMVEQAFSGTGWELLGRIGFDRLPESGEYTLPNGETTNWIISDEVRQQLVFGTDATLRKRWIQDVRERYLVTVSSQPNITRFGLLTENVRVSLDTSIDESGFESFESEPDAPQTSIGADTVWQSFSSVDRAAALDTAVARSEVIILESTRQNSVSFKTLIQPELERYHFARIESSRVTAQGKCRRVHHAIDLQAGSAVTEIDLAVFRSEPGGRSGLEITGLQHSETPVSTSKVLDTAIQNFAGTKSPPPSGFEGYVGNQVSQLNNVQNPFDEQFAILTPDISAVSRDPLEHEESATVNATTHNQVLAVNL